MTNIGIVGCGAIGAYLAGVIQDDLAPAARLKAICDLEADRAIQLNSRLARKCRILSLPRLIDECDLIVEAAWAAAAADIVSRAVFAGKDVLAMSVGGLLGHDDILRLARRRRVKVYFPSGAIAGLDGLRALSGGARIRKVVLTTRKPLKSLPERFRHIRKEKVIFSGDASAAMKKFPRNINIAATLSLAGLGPLKTRVRIIASPDYRKNVHEVEIVSDAGRIFTRTENVPMANNPKTSYLAALSAAAVLRQLFDSVKLGGS